MRENGPELMQNRVEIDKCLTTLHLKSITPGDVP